MNQPAHPVSHLPAFHADGTITAIVARPGAGLAGALLLTLALPPLPVRELVGGRYVLARCGAQSPAERAENWQIYLRRPLTGCRAASLLAGWGHEDLWRFWAPGTADPGYRWLAGLPAGAPVNLLGPAGNGFFLDPAARHLLLLAEPQRAPLLLPLADADPGPGGHVTLLLRGAAATRRLSALAAHRRGGAQCPRRMASGPPPWPTACAGPTRSVARCRLRDLLPLAETIRQRRFRLDPGFALLLVEADLACGYGACLACVVPLANGNLTRACVHGPVFDLLELTGKP